MSASEYLIADLRRVRELVGLTQEAWGERIHFSAKHVGAIERGERPALPDYLEAVDRAFGTTFVKFYREFVTGEWAPVWYRPFVEHESRATLIRHYQPLLIPGLLQTEAYARAVIGTTRSGSVLEDAVSGRLTRQEVVTREANPARLVVVLDEGVLYRPIGGTAVMREQLLALVEAVRRPNVSVFIVPAHVGAYAGLDGPVALASGHRSIVGFVDGHPAGGVVESVDGVEDLERRWEAVREYAQPQDASLELITKAADSWI
jgi:transcriptional regulator with XRE-family HTH domain